MQPSNRPSIPVTEEWSIQAAAAAVQALRDFVLTVEVTGGIFTDVEAGGVVAPYADPDWCDVGEAYLLACTALGRQPRWDREKEHANDEESDGGVASESAL
jgi:hypothetical protein